MAAASQGAATRVVSVEKPQSLGAVAQQVRKKLVEERLSLSQVSQVPGLPQLDTEDSGTEEDEALSPAVLAKGKSMFSL